MEEIISYIMETPENVNGNILREKLKDFQNIGGSSGGGALVVTVAPAERPKAETDKKKTPSLYISLTKLLPKSKRGFLRGTLSFGLLATNLLTQTTFTW